MMAALAVSCSKEPTDSGGSGNGAKTSLSFTYPRPAVNATTGVDPVTRATVPASELEKAVYDLSVFAFGEDGTFVGELTAAGGDYTEILRHETQTIELSRAFLSEHYGRTLTFYFVANNVASKGGPHATAADLASMTATEFGNSLCAELPVSNGKSDPLEDLRFYNYHANGIYEGLLMTAHTEPVLLAGRKAEQITLTRRTARFDVRNDFKDTHELSEIYVTQAPVNGLLFGSGRQTVPPALRDYRMMYGPWGDEYDAANEYSGWFYLYPCTLGRGATEIELLVTRLADNATAYARLKGTTTIDANKRYTLVFNAVDMTFTLEGGKGDDYNEGNTP